MLVYYIADLHKARRTNEATSLSVRYRTHQYTPGASALSGGASRSEQSNTDSKFAYEIYRSMPQYLDPTRLPPSTAAVAYLLFRLPEVPVPS